MANYLFTLYHVSDLAGDIEAALGEEDGGGVATGGKKLEAERMEEGILVF